MVGWSGEDATTFRAEAVQCMQQLTTTVITPLQNLAGQAFTHATQQDAASSADGAAAAPSGAQRAMPTQMDATKLPSGDPRSAAERDTTDPLDLYLNNVQNPHHAGSTEIFSIGNSYSVYGGLVQSASVPGEVDGRTHGLEIDGSVVGEYSSSRASEFYELPDGSRVFLVETTVEHGGSAAAGGGLNLAGSGLGAESTVGLHETTTTYQEITLPPGTDLPPDFDVYDLDTWPDGTQVRYEHATGEGTSSGTEVNAPLYRVIGIDTGPSGSSTDLSGTSTIVESLGDDQFRVTNGPTTGFAETRGFSLGANLLGVIGVEHRWEDTEYDRTHHFESVVYDRSQPGADELLTEQIIGGGLPEHGTPGTSDRRSVTVQTSWVEDGDHWAGEADLFGAAGGDIPFGETGGAAENLEARITEYHHEDGSIRDTEIYSTDPAGGVYSARETLTTPGPGSHPLNRYDLSEYHEALQDPYVTEAESTTSHYVGVPVSSPEVAHGLTTQYGVPIDEGQIAHIYLTPEELRNLDQGERSLLAHESDLLASSGLLERPLPDEAVLPMLVRNSDPGDSNVLPDGLESAFLLNRLDRANAQGGGTPQPGLPGELRVHGE